MMEKKWVISLLMIGLMVIWTAGTALGAEKSFPTKIIELYCPFGAGGSTSMGARIVAGTAAESLGRPVVVVNKPGGGGTVGADLVAKAKPDGYTLLVTQAASNGIQPAIRKLRYKNTDFEFYGQYAINPYVMLVKSDAPWKSVEELVAYTKDHPGELKYCSSGVGASDHFTMELFKSVVGVKIEHLPFQSAGEGLTAILGGHAHVGILDWRTVKPLVEAGKVRVLAQANEKRLEDLSGIPTFAEKGYPEIKHYTWFGIAAPKGVPKQISEKLRDAFSKAFQNKEVIETLVKLGFTPYYRSAEDFTKFVKEEEEKYKRIAEKANIKMD